MYRVDRLSVAYVSQSNSGRRFPSLVVPTATLFDDKVLGDKTPFIGEKGLDSNNSI